MGVLADYVSKEAEQLKAEVHQREEAVKEWTAAVERLYSQLEQWVTEADGGRGLLRAGRMPRPTFQEPRLGVYELDCLQVGIGSRRAEIRPRARHVIATLKTPGKEPRQADGMAEIRDGSSAEYYLFRLQEQDGDHWYIQSVARWNADPEYGKVDELDRDRFEAAILRILK
jgi:hypothetical protein